MKRWAAPEGFADFVRGRHTSLLRFAHVLCGNRHLAEDLVQDALERVGMAWNRIQNADPEGYVRRTITNRYLNRIRLLRRERLVAELPDTARQAAEEPDDGMWRLLATLPRKQRAVLVPRYYLDYSPGADSRDAGLLHRHGEEQRLQGNGQAARSARPATGGSPMIEEVLRQELDDERHALPGWADPVGRITGGIHRRRRRTLAGLASALVILVTAPIVVLLQPAAPEVDGVIPFVNRPVLSPPAMLRGSPRPEAAPCAVDRLGLESAWVLDNKPHLGRTAITVLTPSGSPERCTLTGSVTLTALNAQTGLRESFTTGDQRFDDTNAKQYPATITPGEPARFDVITAVGCEPVYRDPTLTFQGREIRFPVEELCRPDLSAWYREAPLENAPLTVTMKAPQTVQRGQFLDYEVTVLNAFPGDFPITRCPVYLEQLGDIAAWLHLNCDSLTEFPSHRPITFAMRVYVPESHPLGKVRLRWMAVVHGGEVAIVNLATDGLMVEVVAG